MFFQDRNVSTKDSSSVVGVTLVGGAEYDHLRFAP
jgi:hypothetical protein